jgi:putative heme-binding domain-containing protein
MLTWKNDRPAAVPALMSLIMSSKRPQARLHALCTLDGIGTTPATLFAHALVDEHPAIRRHAVRLSEPRLTKSTDLLAAVLKLVADADPHVRMQVAYSLGAATDAQSAEALAHLLTDDKADAYLRAAATSSLNKANIGLVLSRVLAAENGQPPAALVEQLLTIATALGNDAAVRDAVDAVLAGKGDVKLWQLAALGGLLDVLDRRKVKLDEIAGGSATDALAAIFAQARQIAAGEAAGRELPERVAAIRLLGRGVSGQTEDLTLLTGLLMPQQPSEIQSAAVSSLARLRRQESPRSLLVGWQSHTPTLRGQILDVLLTREDWSAALLAAIESGQVSASHLDARRRQQLLTAKSDAIRQRAEKALAGAVDANRQKIVDQYLKATAAVETDATRGKAVFAKRCANCHRLDGVGHSLGPDLAALTSRSREVLLTAVFDPNRAVEDKFLEYVVRLTDGRQVNGVLLEETGASITLAAPEGKQTVIPRSEVEQLKSSGKSLMPEGVEKDITPTEAADMIAYLASSTPPPKQLAGNKPEIVRPFVDGSIRLLATNARVYGPTVVLEEKYRNLGWWSSLEDHAIWSFEVPAEGGGEYRLTLDYACDDPAAGNTVIVEVAGQSLALKVEGTGSWDNFRGKEIGIVKLLAGPGELLVRSDGPIKAALLDLRSVRLAPVKPR